MSACSTTETYRHAGAAEAVPMRPFLPTVRRYRWSCLPARRLREPPRPRPLPVRAEFHAPPCVKAAERSGAPAGLGLDTGWYTQQARTGGNVFRDGHIQDMSSM
jgi:hypothetical protein